MKIVCAASLLFCVGGSAFAANTLIQDEDYLSDNGRTDGGHNYQYAVEQTLIANSKNSSTGVITATYQGIHALDEPIKFDSKGGTRELAFFSIQAHAFNKYNLVFDSRIPLDWDASYVKYERDFYIKDTSGNILYQDVENLYDEQDFRDYQFVDFIGGQPYVGYENDQEDSYSIGTINAYARVEWDEPEYYDFFDALNGEGVLLETYERISMYVIDENGNDVSKSIVADPDPRGADVYNSYNSIVQFEFLVVDPVPEPSSTALLSIAGMALIFRRKR
jgi:hypothetical protein